MPASCLDRFDVVSHAEAAAGRFIAPSKALLTYCPLNGLSNQLLALFAAAAVARDLGGVSFWVPPLVLQNLPDLRRGSPEAEQTQFCAACYARLADVATIPLDEILNVSLIEGVGGVRFRRDALLSPSFRRSRTVVDVCGEQQRFQFQFGAAPCEHPALVAARMITKAPALTLRAQGAAAYACMKGKVVSTLLSNNASSVEPLWIRLGPTVQEYYGLCGKPPLKMPPFAQLSQGVLSVGRNVWTEFFRMRGYEGSKSDGDGSSVEKAKASSPAITPMACAHIRLSLPGEGWDVDGSPFTESIPAQLLSLQKWLGQMTHDDVPVLLLSDAPWLLQRLLPELGAASGSGCIATGGCALADGLVETAVEQYQRTTKVVVSHHFHSAAAQLACSAASHLLLTPKSSFSKVIRMLALQAAAGTRAWPLRIAYTRARVRFAASAKELPLLTLTRACAAEASDDEVRKQCIANAVERLM